MYDIVTASSETLYCSVLAEEVVVGDVAKLTVVVEQVVMEDKTKSAVVVEDVAWLALAAMAISSGRCRSGDGGSDQVGCCGGE